MQDLVPLWGQISRLQRKYGTEDCEEAIKACAQQTDLDNVNVPPSLISLITKLLSFKPGGIMVDIACGRGTILAKALEEDEDLRGEGVDLNQRNVNFSEMLTAPFRKRCGIYCRSAFDFTADHYESFELLYEP